MSRFVRSGMFLVIMTAVAVAGGLYAEPAAGEGWTGHLEALGLTGTIDTLPMPRDWTVKQISSRDPAGSNNDDTYCAYPFDEGLVLANLKGPGCVMRIWVRDPVGTLNIYIDNLTAPLIEIPFEDLFSGYLELFGPPFVGRQGGGYYCYVPMPFKESCCILVRGNVDRLAYQVTYAEFPEGTRLASFRPPFTMPLEADDEAYLLRWAREWKTARELRFADSEKEKYHKTSRWIWPGEDVLLWTYEGPAVITELEMALSCSDPSILEKAWIKMYWDGNPEPGIVAPAGALFGSGNPSAGNFGGPAFGREGERLWLRYPMPFKSQAKLYVVNTSEDVIELSYNTTWRPDSTEGCLYFNARYNEAQTEADKPYCLAAIKGVGHLVGCTFRAQGGQSFRFLEGDESLIVDDEETAGYAGTGTDEYFNGGWYFKGGPFCTPTHGCTGKGKTPEPHIAAYRCLLTDAVPFKKSLRFLLEHGPRNDEPDVSYSSVAFWYQEDVKPDAWPVTAIDTRRVAER